MKNPFLLLSLLFILIGNTNAQTPGGVVNTDFQMWLKANVGVTVEATGKVSQWDDQSGNALNAIQTNATYQPSYTDASKFFNGSPSVDFPQTSLVGMLTSCNVPTNLYSIFVVYNSTSNSTSARRALQSTANNWLIGPHGNNTGFYAGNWVYNSTPNPSAIPTVNTITSNGNATLNAFFNLNGKLMSAAAGVTATASPQTIALGASGVYNEPIGGSIAEVIVFNRLLDANEKRQIESYLAIKYGVTLDQTTATNYYNSAGDVVWNAASNGIYKNNIFALANDNPSALDVQTSRSANSNLISLSNPLILADGDFMFLSDNGLLATPVAQGGLPGGATSASALAWNVSLTGSAGTADITINSALGEPILLIDNDNNGSFETAVAAASSAGSAHTFTAVNLNNNAKIKIGYAPVVTPGAVSSSPLLWLKASDGVTTVGSAVSQWDDQSGSGNDFTQEMASRPTLLNSSINFNQIGRAHV